jgi:hypothetical protein
MKKIRVVAVDIDGTLLDDAKELPPANREALRAAAAAGVRIAIASGRMTPRVEAVEDLLGIDCTIIAYNGAKVLSSRSEGRRTIVHQPLPADVAWLLIEFAHEGGYLLNFYHEDRLHGQDGSRRRPFMDLYAGRTGAEYRIEADLFHFRGVEPTKLILLAEPGEVERLHARFGRELHGRAFVTRSDPEYLEFMAPGVDKGRALATIARHYGVGTDEILALGDADNDIGLLEAAGIGVAVANAREHVRAAARHVTEATNNEGAVAEAVRRWVLASEPEQ